MIVTDEHLPFGPATGVGRVDPDLPAPFAQVKPLPRPRSPEDEPKPFSARVPEWLVAYA